MNNSVSLYYRSVLVGQVRDAFVCDETWHGTVVLNLDENLGETAQRLLQFIKFNQEWNEKCKQDPQSPPDAKDFELYKDVMARNQWQVQSKDGTQVIESAPNFYRGGELSWRLLT